MVFSVFVKLHTRALISCPFLSNAEPRPAHSSSGGGVRTQPSLNRKADGMGFLFPRLLIEELASRGSGGLGELTTRWLGSVANHLQQSGEM